jgi:hypothetical protein
MASLFTAPHMTAPHLFGGRELHLPKRVRRVAHRHSTGVKAWIQNSDWRAERNRKSDIPVIMAPPGAVQPRSRQDQGQWCDAFIRHCRISINCSKVLALSRERTSHGFNGGLFQSLTLTLRTLHRLFKNVRSDLRPWRSVPSLLVRIANKADNSFVDSTPQARGIGGLVLCSGFVDILISALYRAARFSRFGTTDAHVEKNYDSSVLALVLFVEFRDDAVPNCA